MWYSTLWLPHRPCHRPCPSRQLEIMTWKLVFKFNSSAVPSHARECSSCLQYLLMLLWAFNRNLPLWINLPVVSSWTHCPEILLSGCGNHHRHATQLCWNLKHFIPFVQGPKTLTLISLFSDTQGTKSKEQNICPENLFSFSLRIVKSLARAVSARPFCGKFEHLRILIPVKLGSCELCLEPGLLPWRSQLWPFVRDSSKSRIGLPSSQGAKGENDWERLFQGFTRDPSCLWVCWENFYPQHAFDDALCGLNLIDSISYGKPQRIVLPVALLLHAKATTSGVLTECVISWGRLAVSTCVACGNSVIPYYHRLLTFMEPVMSERRWSYISQFNCRLILQTKALGSELSIIGRIVKSYSWWHSLIFAGLGQDRYRWQPNSLPRSWIRSQFSCITKT